MMMMMMIMMMIFCWTISFVTKFQNPGKDRGLVGVRQNFLNHKCLLILQTTILEYLYDQINPL